MNYVFIIEVTPIDESDKVSTKAYHTKADSLETACQIVHQRLFRDDPSTWSPSWQDLFDDIEEGNQTCYTLDEPVIQLIPVTSI